MQSAWDTNAHGGIKQAKILAAEGEAGATRLVDEAASTYFVGNAQLLRKLGALEKSLSQNAKIVIPSASELVNVPHEGTQSELQSVEVRVLDLCGINH